MSDSARNLFEGRCFYCFFHCLIYCLFSAIVFLLFAESEQQQRAKYEEQIREKMTNAIFTRMIVVYYDENVACNWMFKIKKNETKEYYISHGFIIRVIWRLSAVISRFVIISLIWVVLGGAIEIGFICCAVYVWSVALLLYLFWPPRKWVSELSESGGVVTAYALTILVVVVILLFPIGVFIVVFGLLFAEWEEKEKEEKENTFVISWFQCCLLPFIPIGAVLVLAFGLIGIMVLQLGIIFLSGIKTYMLRMIENIIAMSIITIFTFNNKINCEYCADGKLRSALRNERIMVWLILGWVFVIVHIITSFVVSKMIRPNYTCNNSSPM